MESAVGIDMFDLTVRLEKSFGVKIGQDEFTELTFAAEMRSQSDIQASHIHEWVCDLLARAGRPIPKSSWHRVKYCIGQACGVSPWKVNADSWLKRDAGCC